MVNNVRGLKSKEEIVTRIINEENPVILALVETKLNEGDNVTIPGYEIARTDRDEEGGGVLIAYKSCLKNITICVSRYKINNCEMLWIKIDNRKVRIKIGVIYMPQESRTRVAQLQEIYQIIEKEVIVAAENGESILILGDLNCKIGTEIPGNTEEVTKGGRLLLKMVRKHNLSILNGGESCEGRWTRIEGESKSIIDYAITFEHDLRLVRSMYIDEEKNITPYNLQVTAGTKERIYTDHCMISVSMDVQLQQEVKQTRIKVLNKDGLAQFKEKINKQKISRLIDGTDIRESYTRWNNEVIRIRDSCCKTVKARKIWKVNRKLTVSKKKITKELKKQTLSKEQIKELKERRLVIMGQIEDEEQNKEYIRIMRIVDEIKKGGGVNSATFWDVRRKIAKTTKETAHAIMDNNGKKCEDPEEIKRVYADWYKDLLKTKNAVTDEEKEVEEIVEIQWRSMKAIAESQAPRVTTRKEVETVIKGLNAKKAKDASSWKNNIIIEGGEEMNSSVEKICNEIDTQKKVPAEWERMEILATHKKGDKELMPNKRGLFLTNNVSKVYERIVKARNDEDFRKGITQWNSGGIKDRSTMDCILLTTSVIELNKYLKRNTFLTFTDAEKCFDKLWLLDGIGELWRCGTDVRDCVMIKILNQKAEVIVKTPVGDTELFQLCDIVRQGTVYGPQICIATMDNVNVMGRRIVTYYGPERPIGASTFIDDVTGMGGITVSNNTIFNCNLMEERKKMTFNNKNGKTEYMVVIGNTEEEIETVTSQVKNGRIERVEEHKVLGTWMDESGMYEINIRKRKEKLPYMISTVRNQASPKTVGVMAVDARLKLAEIVIVLSFIYSAEAFPSHSEKEMKQLESVQLTILTGILELPPMTPYCALLMETGWWTMKARVAYKKLMLFHNIVRSDDQRVIKDVINIQKKESRETTWYGSVKRAIEHYKITLDAESSLKSTWKKHVKKKINEKLAHELAEECSMKTKSRTIMYDKYQKKDYLGKLTVNETRAIIKARLHMTKVPGNYKKLGIDVCPLCNQKEVSTEHYFECNRCRMLADTWKVKKEDLRSSDVQKLKDVANFLQKVETLLEPVMKNKMENVRQSATTANKAKRKMPYIQSNIKQKKLKIKKIENKIKKID